jgi:hypothetical protein
MCHLVVGVRDLIYRRIKLSVTEKPKQQQQQQQLNSIVLARKRIIMTERPPLVGKVSANFAARGCQRNGFPRPVISVF